MKLKSLNDILSLNSLGEKFTCLQKNVQDGDTLCILPGKGERIHITAALERPIIYITKDSYSALSAYQQLKGGGNPRKLYVFFKEPAEDLSDALKDLKANFVTNYGHFFCRFENVDTMNLHFILQFEAYQNSNYNVQDKLFKVKDGKVTINEEPFVSLDQVPFAALNEDQKKNTYEIVSTKQKIEYLPNTGKNNLVFITPLLLLSMLGLKREKKYI